MNKNLFSILNKIAFFSKFTDTEKRLLLSMTYFLARFRDGDTIIRENDKDQNSLFVMLRGSARVTKNDNPEKILNTIKPGDVFGEISFLLKTQRTSNVIATDETVCFVLKNQYMEELPMHLQIKIKDCLIEILVNRLVRLDKQNVSSNVLDEGVTIAPDEPNPNVS
ncbi:MAG: cyclic nucleotide-binding domain-containing protein [Magnetococcales bacterium]|nr:cyclic nucleotide-binding domain-containing protein [Magnetococcales bacterium]MBF0436941.1 cyclic nucleotide-binding domain-containing protein [Magnetococcales bacterium]